MQAKNLKRRQLILAVVAASLSDTTWAQNVGGLGRIIVPFGAGGAREMPARAIQQEFGKELDLNWIIDAKPGAGGAIGTVAAARAAPDGKTLLMAASSHFVTAALGAKPFYDPIKDFTPVANIGNQSYILMVNANLPVKTAADFVRYAKANPGVLNYNSAGVGSSTHLAMAYFAKFAGLEMQHVPYKGTQEAVTDVTGGRGHAVIVPTAGVGVYLQESRLRVIGLTALKRSTLLPHIPTLSESGVPGFVFESWFGLLAPAATPAPVVEKLNAAVNKVIAIKEVRERLHNLGIESGYLNVEGFNKLFLADRELMTRLVKEVGITRD
jgi:tripartite-type tricarboxylate transporter receptor subunit TctC